MKKVFLGFLFVAFIHNALAQNLEYEVRGKYSRPIKNHQLEKSTQLSDLIIDYPKNWIKDYVSVSLETNFNGEKKSELGKSIDLTPNQKSLISGLELETDILINIRYVNFNSATERPENMDLVVNMTLVPDDEANFKGGYEELKKYLKENLIEKYVENSPVEFQKGKVAFTIDNSGKLIEVFISASTGNLELDKKLIEFFKNMPAWEPAIMANGEKVYQKFEFSMGIGGC